MRTWFAGLRRWAERWRRNHDLEDELAFHLEMRARDLDDSSQPSDEARRDARIRFGSRDATREGVRETWRFAQWRQLLGEMRMAARSLRRSPAFSLSVVLILGLGIGATSAVYSVLDGVLWKSLPFADPASLLVAEQEYVDLRQPNGAAAINQLTPAFYRFVKGHEATVSGSCAATGFSQNLEADEWPRPVPGALVSPDFFAFFGVRPVRGSLPAADELRRLADGHILLSADAWQTIYGGRDDIVGHTVRISGKLYRVLAVLPEEFRFPTARLRNAQFWYVDGSDFQDMSSDASLKQRPLLDVFLRVAPGMGVAAVRSEMAGLREAYEKESGGAQFRSEVRVSALTDTVARDHRRLMYGVFGASLMIALLCALNVSNLLLQRCEERGPELATLSSLGASHGVLQRRVLFEAALLAVGGAACGLAIAALATPALVRLLPGGLPFVERIGADFRVAGFAASCALVTTWILGLVPAWRARRFAETGVAGSGGRTIARRSAGWGRGALTAAQIGIALALVAGAVLLATSYERAVIRDYGYPMEDIRYADVGWPSGPSRPTEAQSHVLIREMVEAARQTPGVVDATATDLAPLYPNVWVRPLAAEGGQVYEDNVVFHGRAVEPGYFRFLGVPLRAGRAFTDDDRAHTDKVTILSESMAQKLWPGQSALGRTLCIPGISAADTLVLQVVGIVPDIQEGGLLSDPLPSLYLPSYQHPRTYVNILYRAAPGAHPEDALRSRIGALHAVKPNLEFHSLADVSARQLVRLRFVFFLLNLFAVTALLVCGAGVFSLLHYSVSLRRRELGVRAAVGAAPGQLVGLVMRRSGALVAAGMVIGIPASVYLGMVLEAELYRVDRSSPMYYLGATGLLVAIALIASFLPARHAARINPVDCLRAE